MESKREDYARKDVVLADRVGWTAIHINAEGDHCGKCPITGIYELIPSYHGLPLSPSGEAAKAELLLWLAENNERWQAFLTALQPMVDTGASDTFSLLKGWLLVHPRQVANAAWTSLGLGKERSWQQT